MKGKIGLEEHFAIEDTLNDSKGFFPDDIWAEVRERILDLHGRRLRLMDEFGMAMMILSLNAPAIQAMARLAVPFRDRLARRSIPQRLRGRGLDGGFLLFAATRQQRRQHDGQNERFFHESPEYQPMTCPPPDLCETAAGVRENHIWYMDTTHMNAKHSPMTAPAAITTHANGW